MKKRVSKKLKRTVLQTFVSWLVEGGYYRDMGMNGTYEVTYSKTAFVVRRLPKTKKKK